MNGGGTRWGYEGGGGMNGGGCGGVHGVGWVVCRGMKGMCREMQLGGGVEEVSSVEGDSSKNH